MKTKGNVAWRPSKFRPPMLGNRASMGFVPPTLWPWILRIGIPLVAGAGALALTSSAVKSALPEVPINKKNIGIAALLGGGGIAAYYASGALPDSAKPIGYALAVAGIASSLYFMFQETPETVPPGQLPPGQIAPSKQVPEMAPGPLQRSLTFYVDPNQPETGGDRRSLYHDQTYRALAQNNMLNPVQFYTGVRVDSEDGQKVFSSPHVDPKYGRKLFEVGPGREVTIDMIVPGGSFFGGGLLGNYAVSFELFRTRDGTEPFMTSQAIPIQYWYWG